MSAHYHYVEDDQGDLVELVTFCGDWCHRSWCVDHDAIYGGWNGCHEIEYQEPCAQCGIVIPGAFLDPESDQHVRCDRCGIGVSSTDGWTNGTLVFCGGVYGNGCDVVYLASEDAVVNGDAVVVAS